MPRDAKEIGAGLQKNGQWRPGDWALHVPGLPLERRAELLKSHLQDVIS